PARGAADDDHRVQPARVQTRDEIGSEKGRGVLLHDDRLLGAPAQSRVQLDGRRAGLERAGALPLLLHEHPALAEVLLLVGDGRVVDGDVGLPRRAQQAHRLGELPVQVGPERHGRVGERLDEVDHEQARALAEAQGEAEATRLEEFRHLPGIHAGASYRQYSLSYHWAMSSPVQNQTSLWPATYSSARWKCLLRCGMPTRKGWTAMAIVRGMLAPSP